MKVFLKVWNIVTSVLVAIAAVLAILLVGTRFVGLEPFTVLSGSMEPSFSAGDLIYVKEVDPFTLKGGDIITFMLSEDTIATHRIVEVVPDESDVTVVRFRTKGDANESEDGSLVHYKNVLGTPVFHIPKLGYVANVIQKPPGTYMVIAGGALLLAMMFIPDLLTDDEKEKSAEKAETK